jgi:hypothetical protein
MSKIRRQDRKHFSQVLLLVSPCFQAVDGEGASPLYGSRVLGWNEVEATSFFNPQQEALAACGRAAWTILHPFIVAPLSPFGHCIFRLEVTRSNR